MTEEIVRDISIRVESAIEEDLMDDTEDLIAVVHSHVIADLDPRATIDEVHGVHVNFDAPDSGTLLVEYSWSAIYGCRDIDKSEDGEVEIPFSLDGRVLRIQCGPGHDTRSTADEL